MSYKNLTTLILGLLVFSLIFIFSQTKNKVTETNSFPKPTNGETQILENQEEGGDARERWHQLIHRAAPSTDWEAMDSRVRKSFAKKRKDKSASLRSNETFANNNLTGEWSELGSNNVAGSLNKVDYVPSTNTVYGVSAGGVLWSASLDGTGWTPINNSVILGAGELKVMDNGNKIIGIMDKNPTYSNNGGVSFTASSMSHSSVDNWGEATGLATLSNGDIYFMRRAWDWGVTNYRVMWIFRSTDGGANFTRIKALTGIGSANIGSHVTQFWQPLGSDKIFVLHQGRDLYEIDGNDVNLRTTNSDLPQEVWLDFEGNVTGTDTTLYALLNDTDVYRSTDMGANWTFRGSTPVDVWSVGISADPYDVNNLYMGAVDTYRSSDGGTSWTKVNGWGEYYSNIDKLHADIMDIQTFKTSGGTEFNLVANHGGLHVSYDNLVTTTNISKTGLLNAQYYDVRTDPTNSSYVYAGSQDQGHQRSSSGSGATGPVNFNQVVSGDYGHLAFSRNGESLWSVYPGATVHYYHFPKTTPKNSQYSLGGNHEPVSGWIFPTAETADESDNSIYMAGGNINGGDGSYLVTLTAATSSPYTVSATQFSYDFRANSNNGTSPISAIEASTVDANRIYVATEDGTFFYTNDGGTTWSKASSFPGPGEYWLYGSTILSSQNTSNLVWFGGSGYSNDPVWKSTDGGVTFTSMSNGLPSSLVHELVANPEETLLFAATDVGPYVYVVSENMWYPMIGTVAPVQRYYSVEYVATDDVVRFGTYGRGIWDFKVVSQPLPVELLSFDAKLVDNQVVKLSWATASEINNDYFEIERSPDGINFESIIEIPSNGNTTTRQNYEVEDARPLLGNNYYRLKQVDFDGKYEYFDIKVVEVKEIDPIISVYPNPVQKNNWITIENANQTMLIQIFDLNGRVVKFEKLQQDTRIAISDLTIGNYFYKIQNTTTGKVLHSGKLIVM